MFLIGNKCEGGFFMGKGKRQSPNGLIFLKGLLLSFGIYLAGQLLVTLLILKGALSEAGMFPAVAALCFLASLAGGFLCARQTPWGPLPGAMALTLLFAAILAAVGILCWGEGIAWTGRGGVLLLCALGGGLAAGLLGGSRKKKRKRRPGTL